MSISIQGQTGWASIPNAIGRSRLPHPTVHLLVNLLGHADGFNASYSIIRKQTGMSPSTISAALENLKKLGLISVKKTKNKGSRFDSNDYDFHPGMLWKLTPEFVDEKLRGKVTATEDVVDDKMPPTTEDVAKPATGNVLGPLQEMKAKNDQGELPVENDHSPLIPQGGDDHPSADRFDEFWEVVPKKVGKQAARKAWVKAIKATDPDVIIAGMKRYRDDPNRSDAFTKNPQGWLNDGRWEDDPLPSRNAQSTNTVEAWLGITDQGFGSVLDGEVIDQKELTS